MPVPARLRASTAPALVELGWEPPLKAVGRGETQRDLPSRSTGHLRWLWASMLVGGTGALLLGASLYVAGDAKTPVEPPERAIAAAGEAPGSGQVFHKGDKLTRHEMVVVAKHSFRAPMTEQAGDHEVIKTHSYVDLSTELALSLDVKAEEIPAFDPLRLLEPEGGAEGEADLANSVDPSDAAVKLETQDLQFVPVAADAPSLSDNAAAEQVQELARLTPDLSRLPVGFTAQRVLARTLRLGRSADDNDDDSDSQADQRAFRGIDVRVLPENLTAVPETQAAPSTALFEERDVVLGSGQTLGAMLLANGATRERISAVLAVMSPRARSELAEGQHVRLLVAPEAGGRGIQRVTLYGENGIEEIVAADDHGRFVAVTPPANKLDFARTPDTEDDTDDSTGISVYESIYGTALKNSVPRPLIEELVRVFAPGVDLKRHANPGDRLTLFFAADEETHPELLYAALKVGGETRQVYRYRSPGGDVEYFDEDGRSLKKFLMRRPVATGRMSSPFGMRYHPILGYARLHNGVDWAAARGTPIMAAGDGTVQAAGVHSGYGNRVELVHANGYTTAYNHMARIARGIQPGAHVKLGQVIGFVGTTGLSTGPHVHYEVTINGHFVDPMKIRLPSGRELSGSALARLKQQEEQIDTLRKRGGAVLASAHT